MGVILVLFPQPKSATGLILRAICLGLLLSGPLLGEGFICILFASPLFLFVGLIIGLIEDSRRKRIAKREKGGGLLRAVLPLPLLLMSLEGTTEQWSFPRAETVTVKRVIHASPETVAERLARSPRFEQTLPLILRAGFPVPTECRGEGLAINDERMIHFAGGEGRPGDLRLAVTESRPGFARFSVIKDTSHIAHWMDWRESEVSWSGNSDKTTTVCWTIRFDRRLDPAWYFGPAENAAVTAAADYLIISCTSP